MTAFYALANANLAAVINTFLITTDFLFLDILANSSSVDNVLKDSSSRGMTHSGSHSPTLTGTKSFVDGFDPDIGTIDVASLSKEKLKYVEQAESAIEEVQYLVGHSGWKDVKRKDGATVKALFFPKYSRKIMMLEATLDIEPAKLLEDFWVNADSTPEWNPDIALSETLEELTPNLRVGYKVSAPIGGGLLASRDFLVVTVRKKIGDEYILCYRSTDHPDDPKNEDYVRAINEPSGFVVRPIYDNGKLKTSFTWVLNADMKLPHELPSALMDKMLPISMLKYYKQVKEHVANIVSNADDDEQELDYQEE